MQTIAFKVADNETVLSVKQSKSNNIQFHLR